MKIGQSQLRIEDDSLIRGLGRYTDDFRVPDEACAVILRATIGAGEIGSIDTSAALSMPGVLAVLTGADMEADGINCFEPRLRFPAPDGSAMRVPQFRPMTSRHIRYLGEPIGVVVAQTRAQAEDASDAILVDLQDRPSVVDCAVALEVGAPPVWDEFPDNLSFLFEQGDETATDAAFSAAAHTVGRRLRITRVMAASIEPRGALATFDPATDAYRLDVGTQAPHRLLPELAGVLGVEPARLRVVAHDCGGSFGMKNVPYPEYAILLWAARHVGRPLRWTSGRLESFQSDAHARDQWVDASLALDADGHFLALKVDGIANLGAYVGPTTPHSPTANVGGLAGVYRTPHIHVRIKGVMTNTQQTAAYRGAGRPEATYIIERMIDLAAGQLGIDRVELRRRNFIDADQLPFKTGLTFTYDSGDFSTVLDKAMALADWDGFAARREASTAAGRLRGIGIANPIEIAGGPAGKPHPEYARVRVGTDGKVLIHSGATDTGQGHRTAFLQIVCQTLDIEPDRVSFVTGDTGLVPKGTGSFGSRTLSAAGTAIGLSIDAVVDRMRPQAAELMDAEGSDVVFSGGTFAVPGTNRRIGFSAVAAALKEPVEAESFDSAEAPTFPNGCHICEVEIDPETGETILDRYIVIDDVGTVVNPMLVKGQIVGGVAQGMGQAMMEQIVYDGETGQLLSASFMDYAMPRACDLPSIGVETHAVPTKANRFGVKGAGEAGTVGALAVVMSAICDALAAVGVEHLDMPATPERVWRAIQDAKSAA